MEMDNKQSEQQITKVALSLDSNLQWAKQTYAGCGDVALVSFQSERGVPVKGFCLSCQSLMEEGQNHLIRLLMESLAEYREGEEAKGVTGNVTAAGALGYITGLGGDFQPVHPLQELAEIDAKLWEGFVIIFLEEWEVALGYRSQPFSKRQVTEPVSEPVVQGPREGTVECLHTNLGMIRQRVKSAHLKVEYLAAGEVLKTVIAYAYLDQAVNLQVLEEFKQRIGSVKDFEVLETAYVEDWIQDSVWSPFPQFRYTERTDTAAAALMDGKILVMVENSPSILICPAFFVDFFNTSEDYYVRTVYATLVRLLRLLAFFIALTLPSIYVALSTFHPELIPTVLLLTIMDTREGIPFPAFFEALIMEISFELLREAGIRLPRPVGSAVSIVGALVIGQAAIMAKIASPIMVIVVAFTGIASFAIPHYDMGIAIRVLRFPYMIAAGLLGGFGLMAAFLLTLLHLTCLHTLGQPYLSSLAPMRLRDLRDVFIRLPLRSFLRSPRNRRLHPAAPVSGEARNGWPRLRSRGRS